MCGLIALLDAAGPIEASALDAGLAALRERGPDGSGRWLSSERDVALGHTRLAIVDVAGGAQPIASEDGNVLAALNGELYGARALRDRLQARGHQLRTRCDAELLVHLYEDEGPELVRHLRGEYAFVLYDQRARRLMAARDPYGVRALYWAQRGQRVLLASTARALFAAGVPRRWDEHALRLSAAFQYPPPGATLFHGVRALPAGGRVFVDRAGVRVEGPGRTRTQAPGACAVRGVAVDLGAALEDAVAVRVPEEVSFACALSGGLDSSAVLALAARHVGVPPPAFTVRFEGDTHCEWELAARTAAALGAPHYEVALDDHALAELLPQAVRDGEGSAINAHLVGKWALARAVARAGHKVLLSGEGADELTFGYAHFLLDAGLRPTAQQRATLRGAMLTEHTAGAGSGTMPMPLHPLPHFVGAKLALGARIHALGAFGRHPENAQLALERLGREVAERAELGGWGDGDPDPSLPGPLRASARGVDAALCRARAWWRASAFERYILTTLGDAVELAHGVEGRPPFLDQALGRVCEHIAPSAFMRGGVEKEALRDALRGVVPEAARARRKQPFLASPMLLSERPGRLFELAQAVLTGPSAPSFVDRVAVADRLQALRSAAMPERRLWEAPLMWMLTTALLEQELLA